MGRPSRNRPGNVTCAGASMLGEGTPPGKLTEFADSERTPHYSSEGFPVPKSLPSNGPRTGPCVAISLSARPTTM